MSNSRTDFRCRIIDSCLRDTTKKWTRKMLWEKINTAIDIEYSEKDEICINVVDTDIHYMIHKDDAPIEVDKSKRAYTYFYSDPTYIFKNPLDPEERKVLDEVALVATHVPWYPAEKNLKKLSKKLGGNLTLAEERRLIAFASAIGAKGHEFIKPLLRYNRQQQPIRFVHKSFHSEKARTWEVHPYMLKEHDLLWYLFCYTPEKNGYSTFALDRMKSVSVWDAEYRASEFDDNEEYYKDVYGVTKPKGESPYDIELVFTPERGPYLDASPIHHSQKILPALPSGNIPVTLRLYINPEIISELLSYGKDVHVIKPQRLRDELEQKTKQALNSME